MAASKTTANSVSPVNDVFGQARSGSITAIIQILNERLADIGVRTRAVLDANLLQLLCEAQTPDQMDEATLVPRINRILDAISPRGIHRVQIYSRIIREQQLLWLDEIQRDPDNHLLWSQQISLQQPNPFKRWLEDWQYDRQLTARTKDFPTLSSDRGNPANKNNLSLRYALYGSLGMLAALGIGTIAAQRLGLWSTIAVTTPTASQAALLNPEKKSEVGTRQAAGTGGPTAAATAVATPAKASDTFTQAVRLAEQASKDGQKAKTAADWLDLAARWQKASDLMAQVPASDSRHTTARDRVEAYRKNSAAALSKSGR